MKKSKFIEGGKVYLRHFMDEDLNLVHFGKNSADVRETLFLFKPYTLEETKHEIDKWLSSKETVLFTICRKKDDKPVGQTALFRIDHISRAAVFYIAIYDSDYWSQGYGSEATDLMIKYSFDILNLNRLQLHVCVENEKGVKAYKKSGFSIEGTLREAMYHNNRYFDFYVMGLLRSEYYSG